MEDYAIVEKISKEINAVHNIHATKLLKKAGLDSEAYKENPNMLHEKGYVFVHESNKDDHRFVLAKVVAEDQYSIKVNFNIDTENISIEKEVTNDKVEK